MAATKTRGKKSDSPPSTIRTVSLTQKGALALEALSQEASDLLGWTISGSAIVRALLRFAEQQGPTWARSQLMPLIEAELGAGVVWGTQKRTGKPPSATV